MKKNILLFVIVSILLLTSIGIFNYYIDPYFHYHEPLIEKYYYTIDEERYQNDGIIRNFEYDAMIIGSSLCQNFKTSEFDSLFGTKSIKVCFSGATNKEIYNNINKAIESNEKLKTVFSAIELNNIMLDKDYLRYDSYPDYLYNNNYLDDYYYLLNKECLLYSINTVFSEKKE